LIAINPFKKLPLYTKDYLASYGTKTEDKREPHVYATMASAFEAMMRGFVLLHLKIKNLPLVIRESLTGAYV
jgi:hypothetical protein